MVLRIIVRGVVCRNCAIVQQINSINKKHEQEACGTCGQTHCKNEEI